MKEALKEILGEECIVTTLKGDKTGKLIEISDGCLVIENKRSKEYINLEFVISAKKHPVNKNGKKKMIVL